MKKINMFYLIGLFVILIGTYIAYIGSSRDSDKTIQDLKDSLDIKNEELQSKQDALINEQKENTKLSQEILKFQEKLDSNTIAIGTVTDEISKIALKTNQISNIIKDEQRARGFIAIKPELFKKYKLSIGGIGLETPANFFLRGWTSTIFETPITITVKDDNFLLSLRLYDKEQNLIFDIQEGNWAVKKNDIFSMNYDVNGVEVIDKKGDILLQINVVKSTLYVSGIFYYKNKVALVSPGNSIHMSYTDKNFINRFNEHSVRLKRIFLHHGENYLGKRLK